MVVQNLPSDRKLLIGKVQEKSKKKTNNSAFSATHTYIKLTLVSFFYFFFMHLPPSLLLNIAWSCAHWEGLSRDFVGFVLRCLELCSVR